MQNDEMITSVNADVINHCHVIQKDICKT